jgi:dolichol-phosphate mannosyltransferase
MASTNLSCVLVMPTYNEQGCIESVVRAWNVEFSRHFGDQFKLVVVNDGAKDATPQILEKLKAELPMLEVVHQQNAGHGAALLTAYKHAVTLKPDFVFQTDSDDQFLPEDFGRLWQRRNESDFILGRRLIRYDAFHRLIITRILRALLALVFQVWITDSNVPYRLIRGSYLARLLERLPAGVFAPNIFLAVLAARDGKKLMSIPVTHRDRRTGTVSIIRMKLLKVCFRSARELVLFRVMLPQAVRELRKLESR